MTPNRFGKAMLTIAIVLAALLPGGRCQYSRVAGRSGQRTGPSSGAARKMTGSYELDVHNPSHDCEQYRWGNDVHLGKQGDCDEPWTRLEENWKPYFSPVKEDHYTEAMQYPVDEARWEEFMGKLETRRASNQDFEDAFGIIAAGRVSVTSSMAAYVQVGRQKQPVPALHHIFRSISHKPQAFPAARDLIKLLISKGASPSTVSLNFQDNPLFADLLMHNHLDAHLLLELSRSGSLLTGSFKFDGNYMDPSQQPRSPSHVGISVLHLALLSCEDELNAVLTAIASDAEQLALRVASGTNAPDDVARQVRERGHVTVDHVLADQRRRRGLSANATTYESIAVDGMTLVSAEEIPEELFPTTKNAIAEHPPGSGMFEVFKAEIAAHTAGILKGDSVHPFAVTRGMVLQLQDDYATAYARAFFVTNDEFEMEDMYLHTPGNHQVWLHQSVRNGMVKAIQTIIDDVMRRINPNPKPNEGISCYRFIANMLIARERWFVRTPLHYAALYHGNQSQVYQQILAVAKLVADKGGFVDGATVDVIVDGFGWKHADIASMEFDRYRGEGGGRPNTAPHTDRELGDWSTGANAYAALSANVDTRLCEVRELKGVVQESWPIGEALGTARPTVIRSAIAHGFDKMTRASLSRHIGGVETDSARVVCQAVPAFNVDLDDVVDGIAGITTTATRSACIGGQVGIAHVVQFGSSHL